MAKRDQQVETLHQPPDDSDSFGLRHFGDTLSGHIVAARLQAYNSGTLAYEDVAVNSSGELLVTSGGGGGGGPATIADGADVAQGALADAAITTDTSGTVSGKLRGLVKWAFERMPASLGQKAMAASLPVVLASDQSSIPVTDNGGSLTVDGSVTALDEDSATGTSANFTGSGASQSIVASNANRKGATVFNDSGVVCYVKLGATASSTSFTVKMVDQSYYEVPSKYTGVVDALWASGAVRVTELT